MQQNKSKFEIRSVQSCGKSFLSPFPLLQRTFVRVVLNIGSIGFDRSISSSFNILLSVPSSESPFLRSEDLLATRELELGTSQSFDGSWFVVVFASNRHQGLANVDTSNGSLGFSIGTSHSSLEPISSGTRQHFVDTDDMEGMDTHTNVEGILACNLGHVLVGTNTSSLQSFSRQLLIFIGHKIHTLGKFIHTSLLFTEIKDSDLWIWDTPTETGFGIGFVFAVAIAASRTATHLVTNNVTNLNISDYM